MAEHRPRKVGSRLSRVGTSAMPGVDANAADDLRFIRQTLERSSTFTAVPGWGMVAVGVSALPAAWFAAPHAFSFRWLEIWLAEAALAVSLSIVAIQSKAARNGLPWTSGPGRKVAMGIAPPVIAAALLTIPLYRAGLSMFLPGTWLLLYGVGLVSGGAYSVAVIPLMGATFMAAGAVALFVPGGANWAMAAGFGVLHTLFGIWIARRHGG